MNKKTILVLFSALFIIACDDDNSTAETANTTPDETSYTLIFKKESAGVLMSCSEEKDTNICSGKKITFTNTNDFPVRIHRVFQYRGEMTRSIDLLNSGENFTARCVDMNHEGFYIRTNENFMAGFLSVAACN